MPCEVSFRYNRKFKGGKIDADAKWICDDSGTNDWPSRRIFRVNTDPVTKLNFHCKFLELEVPVRESSCSTVELFDAYDPSRVALYGSNSVGKLCGFNDT